MTKEQRTDNLIIVILAFCGVLIHILLNGQGHQPLECRFCHHVRRGFGPKCHAALEKDWKTIAGEALVEKWTKQVGLRYRVF